MGVFAMPSLGSDMETGTLVEWLVEPGDRVERGDVVAVVETQKGAIEIETFQDGTVHELTAELGQELPVGAPLAVILGAGEAPPERPAKAAEEAGTRATAAAAGPALAGTGGAETREEPRPGPAAPEAAAPETGAPETAAPATGAGAGAGLRVSPPARVRARELGVDVTTLGGTGPEGAVVVADVELAAKRAAPRSGPESGPSGPAATTRGASGMEEMRKAIAAAMSRAKRTIPHVYLSQTIDVEPAMRFLEARNEGRPPTERLLLGALFVRAAARAVAEAPSLNGHYTDEAGFRPSGAVNAGVAVALRGGGLVAPALMDAAGRTLDETMAGMRDLVTRARAGRLKNSEMTQGTITASALGEPGAEAMTGVIFPPQVALVALGAPQRRPWVVGEEVVPRSVVTLTVSADHRVSDGRQVARFIAAFDALMQTPEEL